MRCWRARRELQELLDGGLEGRRREVVERHVAGCSDCREELEGLERVRNAARRLPAELPPERDLWLAIRPRLGRPVESQHPAWWQGLGDRLGARPALRQVALASAVTLGASLTLALLLPRPWRATPDEAGTAAPGPGSETSVSRGADLARVEDGAVSQRRGLIVALERQRDRLEPELLDAIEADVRELDRAIGEIRLALQDSPEDRHLNLILAATYQQEVHLLHRLERL